MGQLRTTRTTVTIRDHPLVSLLLKCASHEQLSGSLKFSVVRKIDYIFITTASKQCAIYLLT